MRSEAVQMVRDLAGPAGINVEPTTATRGSHVAVVLWKDQHRVKLEFSKKSGDPRARWNNRAQIRRVVRDLQTRGTNGRATSQLR